MSNQPMQPGYGQPMQPGYGQPMQPGYGQPMQPGYGQPMQQQVYIQQGVPVQQPMVQPGAPGYMPPGQPGVPLMFVENPLQELAGSKVAIIEQQVELLEMLTGCETKNRYHVYIQNPYGQKQYLFKCKEESGWCERNCCPSDSRPFLMRVKHVSGQAQMTDDFSKTYAEFNRAFKCTCCCLAR